MNRYTNLIPEVLGLPRPAILFSNTNLLKDPAGIGFVVELTFLNGRKKLAGHDVFSLLQYDK